MNILKTQYGHCNTVVDSNQTWREFGVMLLAENGHKEGDYNPHNVGAWVIGNEFGIIAVGIGGHEQEALDDAVDRNVLDCMIMDFKDATEYETDTGEYPATAGNASEPLYTDYLWMNRI